MLAQAYTECTHGPDTAHVRIPLHWPPPVPSHAGSHVLVSCDGDGEAVIFLPLIFEAGDFGVHGEPVLCFGIKLLSRENKNPYQLRF